ncbi:hypothetical protein CHLNCDRAFT_25190 [Chlorella variabilis]|uniref:Peptidase M41 domain-containing protein n=1 Tax=Chlorella variabilis TaxID=554065 RepID=E1ZJC0_CHLVA|nr:hypothetical protein CHLNCDRAFT_25190 [Chlorella variabilis]EFN54111.1 hypothetical protein CHLNCDRAFT_25190 [Chlorella variabilis]|eukprot:XP_005846213.1 hypothetical protein CHLNCDRAFT_25190 [Chlorella variabilis]
MARNSVSENLQQKIDGSVKKIANEAYEVALKHITENREAMDRIVEVLLEQESITGDEFRALLSQYAAIPQENLDAVARQKQPDAELQLA